MALDPALQELEPRELWECFDALRKIPRPSMHEEGVRRWVESLAADQDWQVERDTVGNVIVRVPGRGQGEGAPPLAIQGHMDMVCAKREDSEHDFHTDPIGLRRDQIEIDGRPRDVLMAMHTTLGSDNGIGIAAALALGLVPGLDHPPLELLFTIDEEQGMTGALGLASDALQARRLLNLDTEEERSLYVSSAGGRDIVARWSVERDQPGHQEAPVAIRVSGLKGGHSGVDIHDHRANAIFILLRMLVDPRFELDGVRLASLDGGGMDNAIPRRATAVLWCAEHRVARVQQQVETLVEEIRPGLASHDAGLEVVVERVEADGVLGPIDETLGRAVLKALASIPDGMLAMSDAIPGLVETSSNLGIVESDTDGVLIVALSRSSRPGALERVQDRMARGLEASGASITFDAYFPPWEARPDSPLVALACEVYEDLFGEPPQIRAVHGGLECGVIGDRVPDLQMVSFGPEIRAAHTPEEALVLDTVEPFWRFVVGLAGALCDA